jgi:hypothetical protein
VASESYFLENGIGQSAFLKLRVCRLLPIVHLVVTGFPHGRISTDDSPNHAL